MSSEITLMCRQVESTDVVQNGVYSTTIDRPITLQEGDEVSIKSATLNVVGDTIVIPEGGLDVELQGLKYLVNYNINRNYNYRVGNAGIPLGGVAPLYKYATLPDSSDNNVATGDNQLYWLSNAHSDSNAHTPYFLLNVAVVPLTKGRGGKRYGGDVLIRYTDPATPTLVLQSKMTIHIASYQEQRYTEHNPIPLPEDSRKRFPTKFYQIKCAVVNGAPSVEVDPVMDLAELNIGEVAFPRVTGIPVQPITPTTNSYEINPQVFSWKATIPEGDYTPIEMAAQLTQLLQPIEHIGATSSDYDTGGANAWDSSKWTPPSASPFLETILQNEVTLSGLNTADTDNKMCFINASMPVGKGDNTLNSLAGTVAYDFALANMRGEYNGAPAAGTPYTPPVDRWVGTDTIDVSYDEDENKMKIDAMHFPIYTNSTVTNTVVAADAKPGVQYNQLDDDDGAGRNINADSGLAKAYSGIAFTAMSPPSFWSQQLGFSNNTVAINANTAVCNFPVDAATVQNSFTISNCVVGQTITEAYAGLSVPVVPSSGLQYVAGASGAVPRPGLFAQPIHSDGTGAGSGAQVTTPDTIAVFSGKTFNQQIQSAGYFLVDVANNFQTDFIGNRVETQTSSTPTNGQDTMGIVGRYYTSNNYLTNQGSGNIVYTHPPGAKPQLLTDLFIKVKNPDGSFVSETILGRENSVFISINRAPRPVNQPMIEPKGGSKKSSV